MGVTGVITQVGPWGVISGLWLISYSKMKTNKQTKKHSYFPQAIATLGTQMVPLQRYAKMIKDYREKSYPLISYKKSEALCQL